MVSKLPCGCNVEAYEPIKEKAPDPTTGKMVLQDKKDGNGHILKKHIIGAKKIGDTAYCEQHKKGFKWNPAQWVEVKFKVPKAELVVEPTA
jgi:hypothetical protein